MRFDFAVQTSNSYVFNFAVPDRREHGDLALPLLAKRAEIRAFPSLMPNFGMKPAQR